MHVGVGISVLQRSLLIERPPTTPRCALHHNQQTSKTKHPCTEEPVEERGGDVEEVVPHLLVVRRVVIIVAIDGEVRVTERRRLHRRHPELFPIEGALLGVLK